MTEIACAPHKYSRLELMPTAGARGAVWVIAEPDLGADTVYVSCDANGPTLTNDLYAALWFARKKDAARFRKQLPRELRIEKVTLPWEQS